MEKIKKHFKPTSWSIDNKTSIYVLVIILALFGYSSYNNIPKEQFPEVVIPTIIINTIYPGTSPTDIENLITRPIEKNLKSISGVKDIRSNSVQDLSTIIVEFQTDVDIDKAKQDVKDEVDKTKNDLPSDLDQDPNIMEIDISELPIMYINLSGNYPLDKIKEFADEAQDRIEELSEITRVDIVGALEKEIQVNIDMYRMNAYRLTFSDIERAIASENVTISSGNINLHGMSRNIRVVGEFKNLETIKNIVIGASGGALVYLKDVAEVKSDFKDQDSYARLDSKNVLTLNIIKKSGQNLLNASDKIKDILTDLEKTKFPNDLKIVISGDQSKFTRTTLNDLNNTIIIGFILVTIVLMFFMGVTNAFFVGISVPLSMALAYIIMPGIDFTLNMLVMFSFIFALGIVVDDAIVVIENTHRIFMKTNMTIVEAAKFAAGEVFVPILAGTLTTLAPFFPLAFWPGVIGKFMFYIPVTIIITLFASLIVAYIINPVFAVQFMKRDEEHKGISRNKLWTYNGIMLFIGLILHITQQPGWANLLIFFAISMVMHNIWGYKILLHFQHTVIPGILNKYEILLRKLLKKRRPHYLLFGIIGLFLFTIILTINFTPKVVLFPDNEPNQINTFIKLPVGTDIEVTDSVTKVVERKIMNVLGKNNPIVESVISNVALGASEDMFDSGTKTTHKGKVTVNFVEFAKRNGENSNQYLEKIRREIKGIPGAEINVDKEQNGPPTGKPVNIEISGDDLDLLIETSNRFMSYLDSLKIPGADQFKTDFESTKPEVIINIDRVRANLEGITTGHVGSELRTAVFGKEASKYREGEDQYPIQLRFIKNQRENLDKLINIMITYRDMNTGILRSIPLSAVAKINYENSVGSISRLNLKRVITINSNVITGYTANEVVADIKYNIPRFSKSDDIEISITGEQEDQKETGEFLSVALMLALCLILFILITQFNSIAKPIIIISEVIFSVIGVLLGFIFTGMPISIIMTGMGLVALAGIVVRNGILLVEFTDVQIANGLRPREAMIQAGKARITPVLLTAASTILGLIPLAIGFNIDFVGLFTNFEPNIHFGGDNVMFFGPLSWTIIFGLTVATFLTLVMIPAFYHIIYAQNIKWKRFKNKFKTII
ncbi:MAG: efflux RND transporter permease subunit [Marinilabiliaceae bacterium]|nr:efflux RND transporter permease subunit [Marinilabiliaceae bacterium]